MTLRRWDIVFVRTDDKDSTGHPGIVLSEQSMLDDPRQLRLNVLMGTKKQPVTSKPVFGFGWIETQIYHLLIFCL